jgi:hypothetical protein
MATSKDLWDIEERYCRRFRARYVAVPDSGAESERVLIIDIVSRKAVFGREDRTDLATGAYILRSPDGTVQYVGLTEMPIALRLRSALANGKGWTCVNWSDWTVSVRRPPTDWSTGERQDLKFEKALIVEHNPPYNKVGRPRKHWHTEA